MMRIGREKVLEMNKPGEIYIHPSATMINEFRYPRIGGGFYLIKFWRPPAGLVSLAGYTTSPVDGKAGTVITSAAAVYTKLLTTKLEDENEHERLLRDMKLTKLASPLEMVYFQFLISGVTRAFTHQLVRYRIGTSFAQLSLRIAGQQNEYHVLVGNGIQDKEDLLDYYHAACTSIATYDNLSQGKVMSEDARGVLPHNILTGIYASISLRSLINIFQQRLCCQAQPGEWQPILLQMRSLIRKQCGDDVAEFLRSNWERNKDCGFHASIDAPCRWRGKPISEIANAEWNLPITTTEDLKRGME